MGSFLGHVVPGTAFFLFSVWWAYNIFHRYFCSKRFRSSAYRNTVTFPCPCNRDAPIEPILKITVASLAIMGEFYMGFKNGRWEHWGNAHHMTMIFFFGLTGVVDLMIYKKWDVPPQLDYLMAALAYGVEGFLFFYHLHGRSDMDIMVHMFLVHTIGACVISVLVEMMLPTNVLPALCRTFFTFLQATWFYHIGFILYPPFGEPWDQESHTQMMIVTLIFAWHIATALVVMFGMGMIVWLRVQSLKPLNHPGTNTMIRMVDAHEELPFTPKKGYQKENSPILPEV